jgi:hypothetical protein
MVRVCEDSIQLNTDLRRLAMKKFLPTIALTVVLTKGIEGITPKLATV